MTKTFTKNDLVRFLYEELNEDERLEMKESLCADMELRTKLDELEEAKSALESLTLKAPKEVVSRILYASKNLSVSS
ncbi:anti-sigma factor [Ekhidna sp.]